MRLRKPGRVHGSWRAPRRRFAAAITPSLVSGTPPSSIPCGVSSDLTRPSYPGAAPHSRPGASASGPLQLSASVCVNMPNLSYIPPLHYTKPKLIDPPYRPVTLLGPLASGCKTLANAPPTLKPFFVPSCALTIAGWTSSRPVLGHKSFPRPKRQQETLFGAAGGTQACRAKQLNELDAAPGLRVPALVCY